MEIMEFTSKRKRMSVVVESKGKIKVLIKGADSVVFKRLKASERQTKLFTQTHKASDRYSARRGARPGGRRLPVILESQRQSLRVLFSCHHRTELLRATNQEPPRSRTA